MDNLNCINRLINCFTGLPGVGYKTAERYAYSIIESDDEFVREFCDTLLDVKKSVKFCETCGNFSDKESCNICDKRPHDTICVVKDPRDVIAIEKSGVFKGSYHVLHGVISPLDKKGPDDLNLKSLMVRLRENKVSEVIIATNPDVEGEATANYIATLVKPSGIRVTRLARGLSAGANLEYADQVTLAMSLENRVVI
ncbi:MAG: recombination mediator RecR [Firmicutes bacterium]|nr:recombination mediator RecR [Bacillota bacterium]